LVFHESAAPAAQSADDEKLKIDKVRRWLSEPGNDQWLFIFDNYDDPRLAGNGRRCSKVIISGARLGPRQEPVRESAARATWTCYSRHRSCTTGNTFRRREVREMGS
jgi:hypothetical protein